MALDITGIKSFADDVAGIVTDNLAPLAVGAGATALAGGVVAATISSRARRKRRVTHSRTRRRRSNSRRARYTPRTAGKGRDRSTRRIRYTSTGQPYVILRSGKARFIKKSGARRSHRTPGGRY